MRFCKLRGAIREKFKTQEAFARALGINPSTLVNLLSGKSEWKLPQIRLTAELLDIPMERIGAYFFEE